MLFLKGCGLKYLASEFPDFAGALKSLPKSPKGQEVKQLVLRQQALYQSVTETKSLFYQLHSQIFRHYDRGGSRALYDSKGVDLCQLRENTADSFYVFREAYNTAVVALSEMLNQRKWKAQLEPYNVLKKMQTGALER